MIRSTCFYVSLLTIVSSGVFCYALKEASNSDVQSRRHHDAINLSTRGSIPDIHLVQHNLWSNHKNLEHSTSVPVNDAVKGTLPLQVTAEPLSIDANAVLKPDNQYKYGEENEVDNYAVESNNSYFSNDKYASQKSNITQHTDTERSTRDNNDYLTSQSTNKSNNSQQESKEFKLEKQENDGYGLSRQLFVSRLQDIHERTQRDDESHPEGSSERQAEESQNDFLTEESEDPYRTIPNQQENSNQKSTASQENTSDSSGNSDAKQDSTGYTNNYVGYEQPRTSGQYSFQQSRTGFNFQQPGTDYTHQGYSGYNLQNTNGYILKDNLQQPQKSTYGHIPHQGNSGYTDRQDVPKYTQQGLSYNLQPDAHPYRQQQDSYLPQQDPYNPSTHKTFSAANFGAAQIPQGAINSQPTQYTPFTQNKSFLKPGTPQEFIGRRPEQDGYIPNPQITGHRYFQNEYTPIQNTYQQHSRISRPFQAGTTGSSENRFTPQQIYYGYTTQHGKDTYSQQVQPENYYSTHGNQQFQSSIPYTVNRAENHGLCQDGTVKHPQNPYLLPQHADGYRPVPNYQITGHPITQNYLRFSSPQRNPNIIEQDYQTNSDQYQYNKNTDYKGNPSITYNTGIPVNPYIPPTSGIQASLSYPTTSSSPTNVNNYYNQQNQQQTYVPNANYPAQNYADRTVSSVNQNKYGTSYVDQPIPGQQNSTFDERYGTVPNYSENERNHQRTQNEHYNTSAISGQSQTLQAVNNGQYKPPVSTPYPPQDDGALNFQTPVPSDLLTPPKEFSSSPYSTQTAQNPYDNYNTAQYNPSAPVQYSPSPAQYSPSPVQYSPSPAQYSPSAHAQYSSPSNYTDSSQSLYQTTRVSPGTYVNSFRF